MRSNKLLKILWGTVFAIFVICVIVVAVGFFGGGSSKDSNSTTTSQNSKQQATDEEKYRSGAESSSSSSAQRANNDVIVGNSETGSVTDGSSSSGNSASSEYQGRKLSPNEGVGTSGKVFSTQKEALEYGNSEIERLVKEDRKARQFSISKVSDADGNIVGWTVDIFENGSN